VPKNWTANPADGKAVGDQLTKLTGKPMKVLSSENLGTMYLLQSSDDYYLWNIISDDIGVVVDPKDYDSLVDKIENDFTDVKVKLIDIN
jgi:hypothetical protein